MFKMCQKKIVHEIMEERGIFLCWKKRILRPGEEILLGSPKADLLFYVALNVTTTKI